MGAVLDGKPARLQPLAVTAPAVQVAPPIVIAWVARDAPPVDASFVPVPLYSSPAHGSQLATVHLPAGGKAGAAWVLAGVTMHVG